MKVGDWVEVVAPGGRTLARIERFSSQTGYDTFESYVTVRTAHGHQRTVRDDAVLRIVDDPVELLAGLA